MFGVMIIYTQILKIFVSQKGSFSALLPSLCSCYDPIMKPDPEYLKELLTAFRDAPNPTTDIRELESAGLSLDDPRFEFHLMLLQDGGFVEGASRHGGIGLQKSADGANQWSVIPLRLTASGHQFAEAMGNNTVLQTLKKNFVGASIGTMREVAVAIIKAEIAKYGLHP